MLDVLGDEHADLAQRQRVVRWDKSKRKYVQSTVGQELSGMSKTKKTRLESGQLVKSDKMKLGELYEKWQKKTNRSIGRSGVFDDDDDAGGDIGGATDRREIGQAPGGAGMQGDPNDKPKTASQIRKEREKKKNMKIKNMPKSDRKRLEQKMRADRKDRAVAKATSFGRYGKKKGPSGRWSSNGGKRGGK
uniref:DBP10 C-terminal domain-containing protein n=1 Tax=Grammatophora oceanica TaxID=210454 RepID=A0A7S1V4V5_9STRA